MENILQLIIFGLRIGGVYALLAIGYTMVYGIVNMINMVHGDFLMIGAFAGYFILTLGAVYMGNPIFVLMALLVACILAGLTSVAVERIAYRPLRNKPKICSLITATGVSMFIENLFRALPFIGPTPRGFPVIIESQTIRLGSVETDSNSLIMIAVTVICCIVLNYFVEHTKTGWQMRAVSMDSEAASLMGINVDRIISVTFFIGAFLAGIGGIVYTSFFPMIDVYMGSWIGTKAFIAAVAGGIGDIKGAMVGGFLLGLIEIFATSIDSRFAYMVVFMMLIVVLVFKPTGLLGKTTIEKV